MRDLEDEKRIKEYMAAKMTHIKIYNECMNLADGLDVEKFAELVRADEREACAKVIAPPKKEWVGLTVNEARMFYEKYTNREELIYVIDEFLEEKNNG